MLQQKGFTTLEVLLVIVLLGIMAISLLFRTGSPTVFQEQFFVDELSAVIRYAHTVAWATSSEVQLAYLNDKQLTLYQRQAGMPFVKRQEITIDVPASISLKKSLPIYIDATGRVYDKNEEWHQKLALTIKNRLLVLDGLTGFIDVQTAS